jgi:hypothetical protein
VVVRSEGVTPVLVLVVARSGGVTPAGVWGSVAGSLSELAD